MTVKRKKTEKTAETHRLRGRREGACIKEEVWLDDGRVTDYNLAYINRRVCRVDHGRVLGYDNSHGFHHRHFMGKVEPIEYPGFDKLSARFYAEVHAQWRVEDEEDAGSD